MFSTRNEVDRAFEWLDNARKDARWLPFLKRLGKAPEQFAAIGFDVDVRVR